jgi:hypothetical protein
MWVFMPLLIANISGHGGKLVGHILKVTLPTESKAEGATDYSAQNICPKFGKDSMNGIIINLLLIQKNTTS